MESKPKNYAILGIIVVIALVVIFVSQLNKKVESVPVPTVTEVVVNPPEATGESFEVPPAPVAPVPPITPVEVAE